MQISAIFWRLVYSPHDIICYAVYKEIMKKILVLGAGGFIGGHLASKLFKQGNWVRAVDIKQHAYGIDSSEFIQGDLSDFGFCQRIIKALDGSCFDEIYQLAADMGGAGYIFTGENDANVMMNSSMINLNILKSQVLLNNALNKNITKIFFSSSACVYPEDKQLVTDNPGLKEVDAYPANPDSEYGWEKLFSERLYLAFHRNHNIPIRIARFHNIFGPEGTWCGGKEKAPAAICRKIAMANLKDKIEIWGDGLQTRSFLYIEDCLDAVEVLMKSESIGPINIGSDFMISINELVNLVASFENKTIQIIHASGPQGVRGRNSNNDLMSKELGWNYKGNLEDGLKKTYFWISKQISQSS
jgi:GDP-D-mannose 3',5'-epimerase